MKRKFLYIPLATLLLICAAQTLRAQDPVGVVVDGVTWAEANVGESGRFVENPCDSGNYYTFDDARQACPAGWRLPGVMELRTLVLSPGKWVERNGITGRLFEGDGGTLFLPAAGYFNASKGDMGIGSNGYYWSGQPYGHTGAYNLAFGAGVGPGSGTARATENVSTTLTINDARTNMFYVRCVKL